MIFRNTRNNQPFFPGNFSNQPTPPTPKTTPRVHWEHERSEGISCFNRGGEKRMTWGNDGTGLNDGKWHWTHRNMIVLTFSFNEFNDIHWYIFYVMFLYVSEKCIEIKVLWIHIFSHATSLEQTRGFPSQLSFRSQGKCRGDSALGHVSLSLLPAKVWIFDTLSGGWNGYFFCGCFQPNGSTMFRLKDIIHLVHQVILWDLEFQLWCQQEKTSRFTNLSPWNKTGFETSPKNVHTLGIQSPSENGNGT